MSDKIGGLFTSFGYGVLPRSVMRDKNLPAQSKAIYAYLVSFAGSSKKAWPSVSLMAEELGMSRDTFYKYMNILKEVGYVEVKKQRQEGGQWLNNVYMISDQPCPKLPDTVKPDTVKPDTVNLDTSNKSLSSNNSSSKNSNQDDFPIKAERSGLDYDGLDVSDDVVDALKDFAAMRRSMKSPLTQRALVLNTNTAKKLSKGDEGLMAQIINQSVARGWKGFFEIKGQEGSAGRNYKPSNLGDFEQRDYADDDFAHVFMDVSAYIDSEPEQGNDG